MKIVFDLDHTLFKTKHFKKDLFEVFLLSGANKEVIEATYKKHCREEGGAYDFEKHCNEIGNKIKKFDKSRAKALFKSFINDADFSRYVEVECLDLLKEQKVLGNKLILLTKGGVELQNIKINKAGFSDIFDKILICRDTKKFKIRELMLKEGDFFINDSVEEILETKAEFPFLNCIILGISSKKKDICDCLGTTGIPNINSIKFLKNSIEKLVKKSQHRL